MPKIQFIPFNEFAENHFNYPTPAKNNIPEWYKKMPKFIGNDKTNGLLPGFNDVPNTTMKSCMPFLDAITTGYMWTAPADIEVRIIDGIYRFRWKVDESLVTEHSKIQHPTLPAMNGGQDFVLKWVFGYQIKTPPGYSTLFTHPINRYDLPFKTFTGIVDTDTYHLPIEFPFQIRDLRLDEILIIEEGTPLCQFFPIKREFWQSSKNKFNEKTAKKQNFDFLKKIVNSYKSRYWHKKYWT